MVLRLCRSALAGITLSLLLAAALPAAVEAQPQIRPSGPPPAQQPAAPSGGALLSGAVVETTAEMLKAAGYADVEIYTARSGARHVSARADGVPVVALHMHCREDKSCPALAFLANFGKQETIDANYMNAWNDAKLYARLYTDRQGDLVLQQDVLVRDVPAAYIRHTAQLFAVLLRDLLKFQPGQK